MICWIGVITLLCQDYADVGVVLIMSKPILSFVHANGFPGQSYRNVWAPLAEYFELQIVDRLGHHPDYPIESNWSRSVDEYLAQLPTDRGPIVALGHSFGGVIVYMAALKAPERFAAVVMLDPPWMRGPDRWSLKLGKRLGLIDRMTPAGKTRGRRAHWPSRDQASETLRRKGLFRRFTDTSFNDYMTAGLEASPQGGVKLRFDPEVEVNIFRNLPDHLGRRANPSVPAGLIYGQQSDLLNPKRLARLKSLNIAFDSVPGGHMFPFEHPTLACQCVLDMFRRLCPSMVAASAPDTEAALVSQG